MEKTLASAENSEKIEIDFPSFFWKIRQSAGFVAGWGVVGLLIGAFLFLIIPSRYQLEMTITSVGTNPGNNSAMLSALTALKQSPDQEHFQQLQLLMVSNRLSQVLAGEPDILRHIFKRDWDEKAGQWKEPDDVIGFFAHYARSLSGEGPWSPPSPARVYHFLQTHVGISSDRQTGFVTVSYLDPDPRFAIDFLRRIYSQSDNLLRVAEQSSLDKQIAYMRARIDQTDVNEYRQQLLDILSGLERQRMIVGSDAPFAAKVLDPPMMPFAPSFPVGWQLLLAGLFLGVVAGSVVVLYSNRRHRVGELTAWVSSFSPRGAKGAKWIVRPRETKP